MTYSEKADLGPEMAFLKCPDSREEPESESSRDSTPDSSSKSIRSFNRALLPLRAHFFFFFGGLACVIPSLILYSQQLGASVSMIGVLFAVTPFVQLLAKPTGGAIADKLQRHKLVFVACVAIYAIALFSINFIPKLNVDLGSTAAFDGNFSSGATTWSCSPATLAHLGQADATLCGLVGDRAEHNGSSLAALSCVVSCLIQKSPPIAATSSHYLLECFPSNSSDRVTHDTSRGTFLPDCNFLEGMGHGIPPVMVAAEIKSTIEIDFRISDPRGSSATHDVNLVPTFDTQPEVSGADPSWLLVHGKDCVVNLGGRGHHTSSTSLLCTTLACFPVGDPPGPAGSSSDSIPLLQFSWLWVAVVSAFTMYSVALSISDAMLLTSLGNEKQGDYGKSRLFGTVGWGIMSPVSACLIDWVSQGLPLKNYSPGYYTFAAFLACDLFICVPFLQVKIKEKPRTLASDVSRLFRRPQVLLFAIATVCQGIIIALCWTFAVIYSNELNGTQTIIGLNYAVECFLSEIPFFLISGWVVKKIGHANAMTLTLMVSGIKALCYSFITDAWFMLPIALMHGATYGIFYATMATYANQIAPPGGCATLQGIFQGLFEGIGNGIGNLIGGFVYERLGGCQTFRVFGVATMVVALLHFLANMCLTKFWSVPPKQHKTETDNSA